MRDVERRLLTEDPEFARSFESRAQRLRRENLGGVGPKIALVAGLLLSALMLVAGSLAGAVAFATATGIIWLAWRFSAATRRQGP